MNKCVERLLRVIRETHTPLLLEVVKSIASLCSVDPYALWNSLAHGSLQVATETATKQPSATAITKTAPKTATGPCWRCPACGKEFNDVKHLVNHILFYVRQRDRAHIEVYRRIKQRVEQTGQTFTQVAMSDLRC